MVADTDGLFLSPSLPPPVYINAGGGGGGRKEKRKRRGESRGEADKSQSNLEQMLTGGISK